MELQVKAGSFSGVLTKCKSDGVSLPELKVRLEKTFPLLSIGVSPEDFRVALANANGAAMPVSYGFKRDSKEHVFRFFLGNSKEGPVRDSQLFVLALPQEAFKREKK